MKKTIAMLTLLALTGAVQAGVYADEAHKQVVCKSIGTLMLAQSRACAGGATFEATAEAWGANPRLQAVAKGVCENGTAEDDAYMLGWATCMDALNHN